MYYRFDEYTLNTERYELRRAGTLIPLRPKVFQLLTYLLAHRERVVAKDELLEQLWPQQFVGDAALNSYLKEVRQAIGDDGQVQRCIQTLRGRGYRFTAAVQVQDRAPLDEVAPPAAPRAARAEAGAAGSVSPPAPATPAGAQESQQVAVSGGALAERRPGMPQVHLIRFGPFTFEPATDSLWRGAEFLPLLPKDAAVLGVLVQHVGHTVPKGTLLEAVWPEIYVTETVLKNSIARLRRVLGDDLKTPIYIETRPRRGYRFLVTMEPSAPAAAAPQPTSPVVQPLPSLPLVPSSMVGREPELALLHERFVLALGGQRQVVWITGEAGIGKTTLLDAFVAQVTAREPLWLAYGQCVEHYGEGEPYRPVLEAVDRLCRGPGGQRLLTLLRQEAPLWLAQLPGVLSAEEIETLERHTPQATPARMQRELAVALDRHSAEMPLVLVLEDLHWSDYATLDLLAILTQRRDPARLLVLGTYRPADVEARAHPLALLAQRLARYAHCGALALTTLAEADIAAYLTRCLSAPTWPPRVVRWLHQRSGGNPLFLVTLVDYLVHHKALPATGSTADVDRALAALEQTIPASLRQMIAAQFQQLPPAEQHVLEVASVAGVEFSAAAVAAGLAEPVVPVEAQCEALARRGNFLEPRGIVTWHDGTVAARYGFRHTLYQQVVYERLPAGQRHQLHQRLGVCFEHAYGEQVEEIATELARHWQQGGEAERAVRYHGLAAQTANRRSAPREASAHVAQALALLQTLPETRERTRLALRLHLTLLPALLAMHGFAAREVAHTYAQAQALWRALGETTPLSPAQSGLWREFYWVGPLAFPLR